MRSEVVTIQPQIVQFGRDNHQTIKIINNTSNIISNFFFCLYNAQKFTFNPDSFSLAPYEHKLIDISLKIKSAKSVAKEFAYLKSAQINKRITLLINQFQSPQIKVRHHQEGTQDINTLSSREYRDVQTQAIEKIIKEKQAYIALLQKDVVNRSINFRTEQSGEKFNFLKKDVEELQMRLILVQNQKQSILKQNLVLQNKFQEYRKYCEADLKNYQKISQEYKEKIEENAKLHQQIGYLQNQCSQFLKKIEQKQQKIRQYESLSKKSLQESRRQSEKKQRYFEERLEQQKTIFQESSRYSENKIKQLQKKIELSESFRQKNFFYEKELKKKQQQIKKMMEAVESERNTVRELQSQKKKMMRYEMMNQSMNQKNSELTSRVKELQKINQNLREQIYIFKGKSAQNEHSSDKINQYLEIALESCRTENQALKRTKNQLQKSLDEFMHINRQSHDNNKALTDQISKYKQEINLLIEIKDNLERRNQELKQEHHLTIMQLKTQNIQLLQKLSLGQTSKRQEKIRRLQDQLKLKQIQMQRLMNLQFEHNIKIEQLTIQNSQLGQRVKKYKKQAKKQLKSINQTAISQLQRQHEQKKQMAKRIVQLQQVILNYSCDKFKQEKQLKRQTETRVNYLQNEAGLRKDRASSRVIGIKDQRKELHYSQASNNQTYSELGQLRELNNFLRNQQQRFNKIFDLQKDEQYLSQLDPRPIFRVIKFLKNIQNKLKQTKTDDELVNIKQIQYLKGRIKELQSVKEQKQNISSINLSKTRQQCSELLEFVRQEMKNQYKKLNETVKFWERKHQLLKKKIYEQYRAKIIETLNKKDKNTLSQLQTILERFIDHMSNLSHKQALLQKEVKLKQNARKQNVQLKGKVNELNQLLQSKKGYCSRDPIKFLYNQSEAQWQQSLKREAEFLTLSAEYQRLTQQFELVCQQLEYSRHQNKRLQKELDDKSDEILKLKKYQIQIQSNYQKQIDKQYQIIEENKKRVSDMMKNTKETMKNISKDRQYNNIKQSYQRQKEVIKQLKDKEKMFDEFLEQSHRRQEKEKKKVNEENRLVESMRDLKENNRQLRTQNAKLKQRLAKIEDDLQKKNAYLKNLKEDNQENRVRVQKKEEIQHQKLRQDIKKAEQQLNKVRDELQKTKRKKQKEISQFRNEIERLRNQNLIFTKSFESIIRALTDTLRKTYGRLKRLIKRRNGKDVQDNLKAFENAQTIKTNALKIDEVFQEILAIVEEND